MKRITNDREYSDDGELLCETQTVVDGSMLISHIKDYAALTHTIITREVRALQDSTQFEADADGFIDLGEVG
jgi:hypothetical protein